MGEKYLVAKETNIAAEKDIEGFFEPKDKDIDIEKQEPRKMVFGRMEGVKYDETVRVKHVKPESIKVDEEDSSMADYIMPPTRVSLSRTEVVPCENSYGSGGIQRGLGELLHGS